MTSVGDVMSRNLLTVEATTALAAAAERMCDLNVGAILVLSGDVGSGILTERGVLGRRGRDECRRVDDARPGDDRFGGDHEPCRLDHDPRRLPTSARHER